MSQKKVLVIGSREKEVSTAVSTRKANVLCAWTRAHEDDVDKLFPFAHS